MLAKFDFDAQILVPIRTFETLPWLKVQVATVVVLNQQDGMCLTWEECIIPVG
ncbi:hypothetical protein CMEL01_04938 [Colletotrichum melonis]|uniref:Uncharacterized protein n=1 Tax=Colletotrichum melonis TaxID=1209925 RepID=A0AAI9UAA1_9PEZI|nr:hypothetical protein CMEL01_04938 [Colletotrichum melonis]